MLIDFSKIRKADNGQFVFVDLFTPLNHYRSTAQKRYVTISPDFRGVGKVEGVKQKVRTLSLEGMIEYLVYSKDAKNVINLMDRQCTTPLTHSTMD